MSVKLIKAFDARCTDPLPPNTIPVEDDLWVDYQHWTVLFAGGAIANILLSEGLGFFNEGKETIKSEARDGSMKEVSFRECHGGTGRISRQLVWAYIHSNG